MLSASITAPAWVIVNDPLDVNVVPAGTPVVDASGQPLGDGLSGRDAGAVGAGEELAAGWLERLRGFVPARTSTRSL
jgi:hypothetical protein